VIVASFAAGRDGALHVVSPDRRRCARAGAPSLRAALEQGTVAPDATTEPFDAERCAAVLPRAAQFLDGSAYVNHVALVRRARGAEMPERFWTDPLMYQGCPDFLPPLAPIEGEEAWGLDFEAEVAVILGDVPRGASEAEARSSIRFVTILNDVSLRALIPDELSKGFGFVQSKPPCAMAPLAVAPDALVGWDGDRLHATLRVDLNGVPFGRVRAGEDMTFGFPRLIAHAARTRALGAGTVIGSGTVSNREAGGPGRPTARGGRGYACIAEQRMVETIEQGAPATPFLRHGDRVRIWAEDAEGRDLFGAIDQTVRVDPAQAGATPAVEPSA
jgi:fumarylacetoacetate (FAA) hydrolase